VWVDASAAAVHLATRWQGAALLGNVTRADASACDGLPPPSLPQVLADIGDSQSLQQNLSTFSGHIARLKLLLGAAGQQSLVLLDEVGSGTDPLVRAVPGLGRTPRLVLLRSEELYQFHCS
jgi:hypothetical protein